MKLRQRSQQVFEAIKEGGKHSLRKIAEATGIAKSSVHRHKTWARTAEQVSRIRFMVNGSRRAMAKAASVRNDLHLWHQMWNWCRNTVGVFLLATVVSRGWGFSWCPAKSRSRGERGYPQIPTASAKSHWGNSDRN